MALRTIHHLLCPRVKTVSSVMTLFGGNFPHFKTLAEVDLNSASRTKSKPRFKSHQSDAKIKNIMTITSAAIPPFDYSKMGAHFSFMQELPQMFIF